MFDKLITKLAAKGTADAGAQLTQALGSDALLAHALVVPAAYESAGSSNALSIVVNSVSSAVSKNAHVGGESGTIARTLPIESETRSLAITGHGISVWDLQAAKHEATPAPDYRIAREHITSFVNTGKKVQGGHIWHVTFVDGSHFGYRVMMAPPEWEAAAAGLQG